MIVKVISYALAATLGFVLAYFIFASSSQAPVTVTPSVESVNLPTTKIEVVNTKAIEKIAATAKNAEAEIEQLRALVKSQASLIKELQTDLDETLVVEKEPSEEKPKGLETITMDDFENRIKGSFRNRFQGVAIELKEDQVNEFNRMFEANPLKSEWGVQFENQISNFITNGDPNGLHFVEEVNCINHMCRLKVQSNESQSWQQLYSSMTKENWFNSMTLVERSDIPGMHVYYIPKPQDLQ